MKTIEGLQIFVRVAELSSFTQAAEQLALPKARVSTAVQQLEGQLGTRLLHRTTRKVQLTQDGQAFYERCKDLLADVDELQGMFQHGVQSLRGRLRVDMPTLIARDQIIPRLPEFLAAHPHLSFEFSSTDRRVDVVREGFDCVLRVGPLADSGLVARPVGQLRQINGASPGYLAQHGTPQTLDDLASHRLIHYVPTLGAKPGGWEYVQEGRVRSLAMASVLTVNSTEAYQSACVAGLGLIQAPAAGLASLLARGLLVEVMPQHRAPSLPVSLLYANRRNLPQRVQVFMAWVAETLAPYLDH
ncbi:LysR family transcriptional regulator [Piscinibacter gummiphilus]|uniref:LysR family transcriptional regulator n=1 Tax=Piscinibacter gummiphilus TaxID=946333 RepID=A0ABZ0CT08_9BURK|nr:LysR family transcriptional regulator [Piscinibacter gummiphilus]WOB08116.1 LysR family transcriptional regulator [Piscinibacter gummiphilus]